MSRKWRLAYARDMNEKELTSYIFELEYAAAEARDLLEELTDELEYAAAKARDLRS